MRIVHVFIICTIIGFFGTGFYLGYKYSTPKVIIKEVEVIKNVDKIIYRDYTNLDCCEIAKNYDTTPMQIKYNVNSMKKDYTDIDLTWRLYERNGSQNIQVPVYQEGNWKFYTGIGIGAGFIGGLAYVVLK